MITALIQVKGLYKPWRGVACLGLFFLCMAGMSTAQAETAVSPLINLQANAYFSSNPDESPIVVSGTVYEKQNGELIPAANVSVRFWQPDTPSVYIAATSDANGEYRIGLSEGSWQGEACGVGTGYYPAAWEVLIQGREVKKLQMHQQKTIEIHALTPGNLFNEGDTVTLSGRGFGCSGELVFNYSNAVDRCNNEQPIEYNHAAVRINEFNYRSDTQLRFQLPQLADSRDVHKHIGWLHYAQAANRSDAIAIGETVLASQQDNPVLCQGQQPYRETGRVNTGNVGQMVDIPLDTQPQSGLVNNTGRRGGLQSGFNDSVGNSTTGAAGTSTVPSGSSSGLAGMTVTGLNVDMHEEPVLQNSQRRTLKVNTSVSGLRR